MKTTTKHSRVIKKEIEQSRQELFTRFNLTELEVNRIIYEEGMRFLEYYYSVDHPKDKEWIKKLSQDPQYGYWNFFLKQWMIRDRDFVLYAPRSKFASEKQAWITRHMRATTSNMFENAFRNWLQKLDKPI